jgi:hypothetical protein
MGNPWLRVAGYGLEYVLPSQAWGRFLFFNAVGSER